MLPYELSLAVCLGAMIAFPYASYASESHRPSVVFGVGLIVAAAVYVIFAALARDARAVNRVLVGLLVFGLLAASGLRWSARLLGFGWLLHVFWDLSFHPIHVSSYAPWSYPLVCLGFDLFVAGYIFANTRPASSRRGA